VRRRRVMIMKRKVARLIVEAIVEDLTSRSGMSWDSIDDDTQVSIKNDLVDIVEEILEDKS
jgi:hypothetical protein